MNYRSAIPTFALLSILISSCAQSSSKEVTIELEEDSSTATVEKDSVDLSDVPLPILNERKQTFGERLPDKTTVLPDKSEVVTLHDGYGNTIETRTFSTSPNVAMIISKTTADGRREVVVYGFNGERKTLPIGIADRAMTESASKIAVLAGITSERRQPFRSNFETSVRQDLANKSAPVKGEVWKKDNLTNETDVSSSVEKQPGATRPSEN